jgi:hypothetical protein
MWVLLFHVSYYFMWTFIFMFQRFDFCVDLFVTLLVCLKTSGLYNFFANLKLFKFMHFICFLNQILIQIEKGKIKILKKYKGPRRAIRSRPKSRPSPLRPPRPKRYGPPPLSHRQAGPACHPLPRARRPSRSHLAPPPSNPPPAPQP